MSCSIVLRSFSCLAFGFILVAPACTPSSSQLSSTDSCSDIGFNYDNVSKWLDDGNTIPARKIAVCQIATYLKKGEAKIEEIALGYAQKAAMAYLATTPMGAFAAAMGGGQAATDGSVLSQASLDAISKIVNEALEQNRRIQFNEKMDFYKKSYRDYLSGGDNGLFNTLALNDLKNTGNELLSSSLFEESDYKMAKVYELIASQALTVYRDIDRSSPTSILAKTNAVAFIKMINKMHEAFIKENYSKVHMYLITGGGSSKPVSGRSCKIRYLVVSDWTGEEIEYMTREGVTDCRLSADQQAEYEAFRFAKVNTEYQREFVKYFGARYADLISSWAQTGEISVPKTNCLDQYNVPRACPSVDFSSQGASSGWLADWENLGGTSLTGTAVTAWGPNRLDVFAVNSDRNMLHKWYDGSSWFGGWENQEGQFVSAPAAASWGVGRLDDFGIGTDQALYHKWYDGTSWSAGWEKHDGPIYGSVATVSWGVGRLDVFSKDANNALLHKWYDGTGWFGGWENLGGNLRQGPATSSWGAGRLDVFGLDTTGALVHKWYDGTNWSSWENLGGSLSSAPAVVSWSNNRIDVFVVGTDRALYHKWYDGTAWFPGWENLGGQFVGNPSVAAWSAGRLDVFGVGIDGALYHRWYQ